MVKSLIIQLVMYVARDNDLFKIHRCLRFKLDDGDNKKPRLANPC